MKITSQLNYRQLTFICLLLFLSISLKGQTIENPFSITENTFTELNLKNKQIINDQKGDSYQVVHTSLEKGLLIIKEDEMEKHGRYFRYSNAKLDTETTFLFGDKEGIEIKYFSDGKKNWEYNYSKGMKNGVYAIFYQKNGQTYQTGSYKDNIKDGEEIQYFENGVKKQVKTYKDGKITGKVIQYNSEGVKISENSYD